MKPSKGNRSPIIGHGINQANTRAPIFLVVFRPFHSAAEFAGYCEDQTPSLPATVLGNTKRMEDKRCSQDSQTVAEAGLAAGCKVMLVASSAAGSACAHQVLACCWLAVGKARDSDAALVCLQCCQPRPFQGQGCLVRAVFPG